MVAVEPGWPLAGAQSVVLGENSRQAVAGPMVVVQLAVQAPAVLPMVVVEQMAHPLVAAEQMARPLVALERGVLRPAAGRFVALLAAWPRVAVPSVVLPKGVLPRVVVGCLAHQGRR